MIRIGIAGIGFMGVTHFCAYRQLRGKVVALASHNRKHLAGNWRDIQGNLGRAWRIHVSRLNSTETF